MVKKLVGGAKTFLPSIQNNAGCIINNFNQREFRSHCTDNVEAAQKLPRARERGSALRSLALKLLSLQSDMKILGLGYGRPVSSVVLLSAFRNAVNAVVFSREESSQATGQPFSGYEKPVRS